MSIEVATYIGDLQPLNPPSTDPRGQGDDHLRLIKAVLQNSFPNLERAFYTPKTLAKSASYSVLAADGETTFYTTTTGGAVTYTLPVGLASTDAGWQVHFIKITSDANPIFIAPGSGTLSSGQFTGLSSARRSIPGIRVSAIWNGTAWFVTRAIALPVGSMIDFNSATLPAGFEWPNGQTLGSVTTNYPEYNAAVGSGITLDLRGRAAVTLDNLGGSAAGRLAGGIISGSTLGATGGTDIVTLDKTMIPTGITSNGNNSISVTSSATVGQGGFLDQTGGTGAVFQRGPGLSQLTSSGTNAISVTSNNTGGLAHSNLQPSIMCAKILVVE